MVESWTTTHYNGVSFISLDFSKHVIAIFLKLTVGFFCCTTGHLATRPSHVLCLPHVIQWPALVITTLKTRLDRALTRNKDVSINRRGLWLKLAQQVIWTDRVLLIAQRLALNLHKLIVSGFSKNLLTFAFEFAGNIVCTFWNAESKQCCRVGGRYSHNEGCYVTCFKTILVWTFGMPFLYRILPKSKKLKVHGSL